MIVETIGKGGKSNVRQVVCKAHPLQQKSTIHPTNAFFKVGQVLPHDDDNDRFLKEVFFVDLFLELAGDRLVGGVTGGR